MSHLIGQWQEGLFLGNNSNLAVAMFLVMVCTMEVILLKVAAAPAFNREIEFDNSSEYEEDIYYEELYDRYSLWPRRRRTPGDNLEFYN